MRGMCYAPYDDMIREQRSRYVAYEYAMCSYQTNYFVNSE